MVESVSSFSRNIDLSFKNVREDINKLKLSFSKLNDCVADLNNKNGELLSSFEEIKRIVGVKGGIRKVPEISRKIEDLNDNVGGLKKLVFYDVKAKKRFESDDYRELVKSKTLFAVSKSPYGDYECYRILKKV
jgi:hypothetical protein